MHNCLLCLVWLVDQGPVGWCLISHLLATLFLKCIILLLTLVLLPVMFDGILYWRDASAVLKVVVLKPPILVIHVVAAPLGLCVDEGSQDIRRREVCILMDLSQPFLSGSSLLSSPCSSSSSSSFILCVFLCVFLNLHPGIVLDVACIVCLKWLVSLSVCGTKRHLSCRCLVGQVCADPLCYFSM